jgi:threonine dehydrogenase-like Zn-dependent dehydrogenase
MTTDDEYFERGISRLHGYFSEYYVESADYIVRIPQGLKEVGVLLEPTSVVEKGIVQAYEIQRRLKVWRPVRAAVLGVGPIGMLATMALRMRGLDVHAFGLNQKTYSNQSARLTIPQRIYQSSKPEKNTATLTLSLKQRVIRRLSLKR